MAKLRTHNFNRPEKCWCNPDINVVTTVTHHQTMPKSIKPGLSFFDMSEDKQKDILHKAAVASNEDQAKLMRRSTQKTIHER